MNTSIAELSTEGKRIAIEIISTLVNIKSTMIELILKPAGVPAEAYQDLLRRRDETTGYNLSKRKMAPLILERVTEEAKGRDIILSIIEIASEWDKFHLAHDEYAARATVQKARDFLGTLKLMEAREEKQRELARQGELERLAERHVKEIRKHSDILLMMFDELTTSDNPQQRGFLLQELLNRLFTLHRISVVRSFTRNEGAEQIDGAFKLEGWHYLVECRWRKKLADTRELDGIKGQVDRSGKQTMGLFLSINGWSPHVTATLKQNPDKSIILMDGYDLRTVLERRIDLRDLIAAKIAKLNFEAEPFYSVSGYLKEKKA